MPDGPLTIAAAGDVIPARPLFPAGPELERVLAVLQGADVAVGNLDSALTTRGYPREKLINVRANPDVVAPDLGRMGFDVISVANNHATDFGETGLSDTVDALRAAGVQPVGGGEDLAAATAPVIVEAAGWRVGVSAWTAVLPTGAAASPVRPGLAPLHVRTAYEVDPYLLMEEPATVPTVRSHVDEADLARACETIGRLRAEADFVVALVHWGGGLSEGLAEYQSPLGRALLDAGADVVVGSHPHRVLGIERHGEKAIIYSGGTLVEQIDHGVVGPELAHIFGLLSPDSFIATLDVAPDGRYGMRITPTTIVADGIPQLADAAAFDRIAERVTRLSAELGTAVELRDGELHVVLGAPVAA
jgi:poly-gamma-glutamate capsule biosynthesis protein CapA/YwtB (metallophosphatase superfamily)